MHSIYASCLEEMRARARHDVLVHVMTCTSSTPPSLPTTETTPPSCQLRITTLPSLPMTEGSCYGTRRFRRWTLDGASPPSPPGHTRSVWGVRTLPNLRGSGAGWNTPEALKDATGGSHACANARATGDHRLQTRTRPDQSTGRAGGRKLQLTKPIAPEPGTDKRKTTPAADGQGDRT